MCNTIHHEIVALNCYDVDDEGRLTVLGIGQLIYGVQGRVVKAFNKGKETVRYFYHDSEILS